MSCDTKRKFATHVSEHSTSQATKRLKLSKHTSKSNNKKQCLKKIPKIIQDVKCDPTSQLQQQQLTHQDNYDKDFEDFRCPICWELAYRCHITNPCGHTFCQTCISDWLKIKQTCPTCQQRILSTTFVRPVSNLIDKLVQLNKFGEQICSDINLKNQNPPEIVQSIRLPASSLNFLQNLFQRLRNSRRNSRLNAENNPLEAERPLGEFSPSESSSSSSSTNLNFERPLNTQEQEAKDQVDFSHLTSGQSDQNVHSQQPSGYILAPAFYLNTSDHHPNLLSAPFNLRIVQPQSQSNLINENHQQEYSLPQHFHPDSHPHYHLDHHITQQQQQQQQQRYHHQQPWQNRTWFSSAVQPIQVPLLFVPTILASDPNNLLQRTSGLQFQPPATRSSTNDRIGVPRSPAVPLGSEQLPQTIPTPSFTSLNFAPQHQGHHF